jgi:hypothetical protein
MLGRDLSLNRKRLGYFGRIDERRRFVVAPVVVDGDSDCYQFPGPFFKIHFM